MKKRKSYKRDKSDRDLEKDSKKNVISQCFLETFSQPSEQFNNSSSVKMPVARPVANRGVIDCKKVLPQCFESYLRETAGDLTDKIIDALLNSEPTLSIRLNPFKPVGADVDSVANDAFKSGDRVPWCANGYYLSQRPQFTFDPALHAGAYYVQEPSSMFLEMLRPVFQSLSPRNVLDLCAAPGGKSTHLISMLPLGTRFTVNEVVKPRLSALRENILKWGVPGIQITSKEAHQFAPNDFSHTDFFDFILVDAPCSGEGMFRKDPGAISEWSEENVKMCAARQKKIVHEIWGALRPGGLLAYSTCTFNRYENDMNVVWMKRELGASLISLEEFYKSHGLEHIFSDKIREEWGIKKSEKGGYQFFPGISRGEGLYVALLYKPEFTSETAYFTSPETLSKPKTSLNKTSSNKLSTNKGFENKLSTNKTSSNKQSANNASSNKLSTNKSFSGSLSDTPSLAPLHEEALLININLFNIDSVAEQLFDGKTSKWPDYELTKDQALKFLSRESLVLEGAPPGYLKVTYGGLGLGFVKNIGSRANNLLPTNLRIRTKQ